MLRKLTDFRITLVAFALLLICLQTLPHWHLVLEYRADVLWQEPWRFLTAHLIHLNWAHALLNIAALLIIGLVFKHQFQARTFFNAVITIAVVSSLVVWLIGAPERFVGFSAVLHGLLLMALLNDLQRPSGKPDVLMGVVIAVVVLKVVLESFGISLSDPLLPFDPYLWAMHTGGLIGGLLAWRLHQRSLKQLALREQQAEE
ncbi:rhomboid family GlyGly-CTERM serine protease [Pseudidiomarina planktonica]|uniref:Rhomboid family GlyGly-CTERM serine protease n=1 Tax=Pseudidiomarina planktonica TaxID=1323738 RepID=A0A1Y6ER68_9GAMM|nr:rhombosortase [Pseudidiomarina planktonica]RUO65478.1 rhombosortase [Pseudidiomarina planktonica]SMQ64826.1 rhomboid family GlyGly-CTERM serine protease [Pseudidiomarina planktonica]